MSTLKRVLAVWTAMLTLLFIPRPNPAAASSPTVFLNHFFVVISSESYAAMLADPYLTRTFAPFEKRTTVRNDNSYTGAYWYGRTTYFEVFEPPAQGPVGASGMALSVDGAGESAAVKAAWATSLGAAQTSPVTRRAETAEPTWFHVTTGRDDTAFLHLWLMEYDQDFLARWYPELTPARGMTRGEVLDRYVAKIGRLKDREALVLGDVTSLLLALDDGDRERLRKHAVPAGWVATPGPTAGDLNFDGPDGVRLEVMRATATRRGVIEAQFSVQGAPKPHSSTLGSVQLTVEATRARLRFAP